MTLHTMIILLSQIMILGLPNKRKFKSLSKKRTSNSVRRNISHTTGNGNIRTQFKVHNDFDTESVFEGLDEIDMIIDQLENDIPEDVFEDEEVEVEDMMKANRMLREKIGDIAKMVVTAIQKAAKLKKQIITHRDGPADPEVANKTKTIQQYQVKLSK